MTTGDNTFEALQKIERIRRRMVANISGSALHGADEIAESYEIVDSEYPRLQIEQFDYAETDQHLGDALEIRRRVLAEKDKDEHRTGTFARLARLMRQSFRWYTDPEDEYWGRVLGSMRHIVTSLKVHESFVRTYAIAIDNLQQQNGSITGTLTGIRRDMMSVVTDAKEPESSTAERREQR